MTKKDKEKSDKYLDDLYKSEAFFKCIDKNMREFTGFIADIIPGKVIREEINGIAKANKVCIYRIHYYTKYFKLEELRQKLLNNEIINDSDEDTDKPNEVFYKEENDEKELFDDENVIKYDVSERNENSIIYKIYSDKTVFILEDKNVKNRNNVKNTLNRFIFCNRYKDRKDIIALVKKQKYLKKNLRKKFELN